jgi:ABC-2 type transport system permease protein
MTTPATALPTTVPTAVTTLPGAIPLGLARATVELRTFFRDKSSVVFTFALPVIMLVLLGSVFSGAVAGTGITGSQLFVGGMVAGGVASTSFITLGAGIATDRENGTLKRLRGTPMPPVSYFLGKVLLVLVASLAEVAIMLAIGATLFGLELPTGTDHWLTFAWVFGLGVTACSLLGIAVSSLARNARSGAALSNLVLIVLSFASGVYVPVLALPAWLSQLGALFPLKWMAQGMRSAFLPDELDSHEIAGAWEHGRVALVLVAWCIGGLVLCLLTFRWRGAKER